MVVKLYLAPLDTNLNPDPEQVDFDPVSFLPTDSSAVIGWDGRAGTIEGLALELVTGRLTRLPFAYRLEWTLVLMHAPG